MSDLRSVLDEVLEILGGATAENAESTKRAVKNHLLCREVILLRAPEADDIRSEDTDAHNYPVPTELLPTRALAHPGPPPTFSSLAYNCLVAAIDALVLEEALPWGVLEFPAREARTLDLFRRLRKRSQDILLELVPPTLDSPTASPSIPAPSSDSQNHLTVPLGPLPDATAVYSEQTEVWLIYQDHGGSLVRLTLGGPLLNTRTARVPPIFLNILILDFDVSPMWSEESTAKTLAILGEPLIPTLTFVHPPRWFIRNFFERELNIQHLKYHMGGTSTTLNLRTETGRAIEFVEADLGAVELALFGPAVFRTVTTLVISHRLITTTLCRLRHLVADVLTSVEIELDETYGQQRIDESSLLTHRNWRFRLFAKATTLRLVLAPHVSQSLAPLVIWNAEVNSFLRSFSPGAVVQFGHGVMRV